MAEDDPYPKKNIVINPIGESKAGKPWEKYGGVGAIQGGVQANAPAMGAPEGKPWEKYGGGTAPMGEGFKSISDTDEKPGMFKQGAQAIVSGFKKVGEHLGIPEEEIKNKKGETVFPTNPAEKFLQSTSAPTWELVEGVQYGMRGGPLAAKPAKLPQLISTEIQKRFSPTTVSPIASEAEASIRKAGGEAARRTASAADMMEPYHRAVNEAPPEDRLAFIDTVEGGTPQHWGYQAPGWNSPSKTALLPLAEKLRVIYQARRAKLEAMPATQKAQFIDEYFPHMWKDPTRAQSVASMASGNVASKGSPTHQKMVGIREKPVYQTRQGSGASLRKRVIPTIKDGIDAGLEPISTDPIEITMRYVSSMDAFIAQQEVFNAAVANGTIKYAKPKTTGASGHPESFQIPEGYVALKGRGATKMTGEHAYAPADWARVYNNYIDQGIHASAAWGNVYDAFQSASNSVTAMELGLSGFHAFTMANEAFLSDLAKGISELVGGKPIKALGTVAKAPAAPILHYKLGKKGEQIYLGRTQGSPDLRKLVDLQTQAGGRAVGKSHAPDYRFSRMGSFWTSWKRGALKAEMAQTMADIKSPKAPLAMFKLIGRTMETVAQPLFEKYIPRVKNGAFYDTMRSWLEANPQATNEQQVAMARKIWDSIDNRFGEMVQDNIFWNKSMKQAAQLAMRSYSWNMGTIREIGGGAKTLLQTPNRLSMSSPDYDPRAAYVIALPIGVSMLNAVYQFLKTGKSPESVKDLVAPRTGGTSPGFGGRGEVEERAMLPGYHRDVLGWYNDAQQELANKVAKGPHMVGQAIQPGGMKDFAGHPVIDPSSEGIARMGEYLKWVYDSMAPISVKGILQGQKKGSNLGPEATVAGIRPAPMWLQDPEGTKRGMSMIEHRAQRSKQKAELRKQRQYGGPQE